MFTNVSHDLCGPKNQPATSCAVYDGFQCSLGQIKNRYPLSGLFREKTVKTLYEWISCLALTAPTKINSWDMRQTVPRQDLSVKYLKKHIVKWKITRIVPVP